VLAGRARKKTLI